MHLIKNTKKNKLNRVNIHVPGDNNENTARHSKLSLTDHNRHVMSSLTDANVSPDGSYAIAFM